MITLLFVCIALQGLFIRSLFRKIFQLRMDIERIDQSKDDNDNFDRRQRVKMLDEIKECKERISGVEVYCARHIRSKNQN